jgi:deoxyribonuclease V
MLACMDVAYRDHATIAGCVLFRTWTDDQPADQVVVTLGPAAAYQPGEFYLRELPPILAALSQVQAQIETVVIDGYVWLNGRMGLGAHLYSALGAKVAVIGVAKNTWRGPTDEDAANASERGAISVTRGGSKRPLYITAAGIEAAAAAKLIAGMHGPFRIPTLLATVDRIVRGMGTRK